jgi:hypothetical protein
MRKQMVKKFIYRIPGLLLFILVNQYFVLGQNLNTFKVPDNAFPAIVQFSGVPSGKGWRDEKTPLNPELQKETIDNIIDHGFSILSIGNWTKNDQTEENKFLLNYAQSRGMKINYITPGFEIFKREYAPATSVYSPQYKAIVQRTVDSALSPLKKIERIYSVFPYQDEPFHASPESFDYSRYARDEFYKRYKYPMPDSLGAVKNDPRKWLDLLNFQSTTFPDGWRKVYKILKESHPGVKVVLTHDSHSTFGAGVKSDSRVAMDDVYHWGGDFADVFVYDIYPYTMYDYRYGEMGKLPKPRISQMHYTISQMRNVTTAYGKEMGFWVGTYNERWFKRFMSPEMQRQYWAERELAYTAVLITGIKIPSDSLHWDDLGKGLRIIQKAGPGLLETHKVKAKACLLFPRTQYLLLQEEFFNVGLSFELFLRSFGELDILHEEQITDDNLNGYKILLLADVKLLPARVAKHIATFVSNGGIVISDCVPQMDENKQPLDVMKKLFGVSKADTGRIIREGQWVPFTTLPPKMSHPPAESKEMLIRTDLVEGSLRGNQYQFKAVSPRAAEVTDGKTLLKMKSGIPALVQHKVGKGEAYLLGFCLQDTYFQTWKDSDIVARDGLQKFIDIVFEKSKVEAHVYSSNREIEVSVRADSKKGFVFIINHEAGNPKTDVHLRDFDFKIKKIMNIETDKPVEFKRMGNEVIFTIIAPIGTTRLLKISE